MLDQITEGHENYSPDFQFYPVEQPSMCFTELQRKDYLVLKGENGSVNWIRLVCVFVIYYQIAPIFALTFPRLHKGMPEYGIARRTKSARRSELYELQSMKTTSRVPF